MAATAQRLPQIVGQRPNVGSGRANHAQLDKRRLKRHQRQVVNRHVAHRRFDVFAAPRSLVERLAVLLNGGVNRRALGNLTSKGRQRRFDFSLGGANGHLGRDLAFRVVGVGRLTKPHLRKVGLGLPHQILYEPRGSAEAQQQHARRQRIKRARMANAPHASHAPHARHHVMRRHAFRLIDIQKSEGIAHGKRSQAACAAVCATMASLQAATTVASAWASGPGSVQPAASA